MKKIIFLIGLMGLWACESTPEQPQNMQVQSPGGEIVTTVSLTEEGQPSYGVTYKGSEVIAASGMGFDFKDQPAMATGFEVVGTEQNTLDETWEMPWGEQTTVRNHYNQLTLMLQEKAAPNRKLNIHFKVYDDGLGFRYEFLEQEGIDSLVIMGENTEFALTEDHTAWWIPGDWDMYEHLYNETKVSEIDAISKRDHPNLSQTYIPENAVNTPVTMRAENGVHLSFHEANLTNYAGMTLKVDTSNLKLHSELVGSDLEGYKAKVPLPFKTPWRTIQITDSATKLIDSKLIVNLNEPNELGDVSYFKPMKYVGIWWEMHLDKSTWNLESGRHGATTENAKRYIDFAAANNIGGVLVEGWNTGWERWIGFDDREGVFDFVTPYEDYDLEEVVRYAKEKGVEIIMHHETSAAPRTYDQQLDTAYKLMERLGIHSVKTGYVGPIIPAGEHHHGQWMVNHYRRVVKKGIEHQVAINAHEPIKATGLRRTYPNIISREGLRGQEFNAWSVEGGNPPEHLPIVAFTRMLAGPIDFTPGVFNIKMTGYKEDNQVKTTLAQQLALYVVIYSPIQMACDLIEHYEGQPAFQFIRDVGVDWEETVVLNGEVGDYVTIARKEKETGNWFLGSITDEEPRSFTVDFSFLDEGVSYKATIYKDGENAHWKDNPTDLTIEEMGITSATQLEVNLAAGGGIAISLMK